MRAGLVSLRPAFYGGAFSPQRTPWLRPPFGSILPDPSAPSSIEAFPGKPGCGPELAGAGPGPPGRVPGRAPPAEVGGVEEQRLANL